MSFFDDWIQYLKGRQSDTENFHHSLQNFNQAAPSSYLLDECVLYDLHRRTERHPKDRTSADQENWADTIKLLSEAHEKDIDILIPDCFYEPAPGYFPTKSEKTTTRALRELSEIAYLDSAEPLDGEDWYLGLEDEDRKLALIAKRDDHVLITYDYHFDLVRDQIDINTPYGALWSLRRNG